MKYLPTSKSHFLFITNENINNYKIDILFFVALNCTVFYSVIVI